MGQDRLKIDLHAAVRGGEGHPGRDRVDLQIGVVDGAGLGPEGQGGEGQHAPLTLVWPPVIAEDEEVCVASAIVELAQSTGRGAHHIQGNGGRLAAAVDLVPDRQRGPHHPLELGEADLLRGPLVEGHADAGEGPEQRQPLVRAPRVHGHLLA
jgi:hypothetical protein